MTLYQLTLKIYLQDDLALTNKVLYIISFTKKLLKIYLHHDNMLLNQQTLYCITIIVAPI